MHSFLPLLSLVGAVAASAGSPTAVRARAADAKITLAVQPVCGPLSGATPADANAGLDLKSYKTIVVFGDGYSSGGTSNGSPLPPAVLHGTNPQAGGRMTNGPLWIEDIASDIGATVMDYAINGSVTEEGLWPGVSNTDTLDNQVNTFAGQPSHPDADTTLYVIFMGIDDYTYAIEDDLPTRFANVAGDIIYDILELTSEPAFAKNILVVDNYGRGTSSAEGQAYKLALFQGLDSLNTQYHINVGFVDLSTIWDGVLGSSPGYEAFGYTSSGSCTVNANTTVGACEHPETTFYWIPGFPSAQTHRIMADFVEAALTQCT